MSKRPVRARCDQSHGGLRRPFLSTEEWKPQVIVLPIPVPIFVPVPMHLYCQKVPVPFSMPIPVSPLPCSPWPRLPSQA